MRPAKSTPPTKEKVVNTFHRSFRRGYTLVELIFTILLAAGGLFVIVFAFALLRLVINLGV